MMLGSARRAKLFAIAAHAAVGQVRKYTGNPYIEHPKAVVEIVATTTHDTDVLAAAWLHDTLEDTQVTASVLREEFGDRITNLVVELTDTSRPEDGNRAARKAIDRKRLAEASADAQTIKLADLIDNSRTILERDPGFAKVYMEEKEALLKVLTKGDEHLQKIAWKIVVEYRVCKEQTQLNTRIIEYLKDLHPNVMVMGPEPPEDCPMVSRTKL